MVGKETQGRRRTSRVGVCYKERDSIIASSAPTDPRSCSIAMDGFVRVWWCIDAITRAIVYTVLEQKVRESIGTPQKGGSTLAPSIDCWMGNNWLEKHGTVRVQSPEGGLSAIDRLLNPFSCRPPYSRGGIAYLWSFYEVLMYGETRGFASSQILRQVDTSFFLFSLVPRTSRIFCP